MAKLITKADWSSKKKTAGSDELIRDQWHIGDHLEEYGKLAFNAFDERIEKLGDIKRKFGEYKKALVNKDKNKAFTDFVADIDKCVRGVDKAIDEAVTAKGVAAGSTDSMKRACEAHLEIRKKALGTVTEVVKVMRNFADEAQTGLAIADKGLQQAIKSKTERNITMNREGINLAHRGLDAVLAALEKARTIEKDKLTKSTGHVIAARLDGPIRQHEAKLDKDWVTAYKQQSGKYFADANKITEGINLLLRQMVGCADKAREALEEAEANSMAGVDTQKMMLALQEVRRLAAEQKSALDTLEGKIEGDKDRLPVVLKDPTALPDQQLKTLKLTLDKMQQGRQEQIASRVDKIKSLIKRAATVPANTDDTALTKLRSEVVEETQRLGQLLVTIKNKAESVEKLYGEAIAKLGG